MNTTTHRRTAACGLLATLLVALPAATRAEENAAQRRARQSPPTRNLDSPSEKALYCVGYAHLDTQWRWDFVTTIDDFIKATLDENFDRFENYPGYVFNFTGSVRYAMMKEYYPEKYERLKTYIRDGRWFVSGSSVDEGDVNVPSPESIIRQILYGNLYFKREFGKESVDFMLPDCFGFPASMPSIWAHCGLLGFSTQKLTWGSAVGIPFKVGKWIGPDGNSVLAALDPGAYVGAVEGRVDENKFWLDRVKQNGDLYNVWADYHYYGVGDQGGAPRAKDVANYTASARAVDSKMDVVLTSSDQLYRDITADQRRRLPEYKGDMLLTEHSAGTLTSQSYMKRWNRQGEQLADAAERFATMSWWLGESRYPRRKLEDAWVRLLANQMHDILPGTSIPRAYRYSWNDDVIALNLFGDVYTHAVGSIATRLDTRTEGIPIVVSNPLVIERTDPVEITVPHDGHASVAVYSPAGLEVPSQVLERNECTIRALFLATVPPNGLAVYDVRPAKDASDNAPNDDRKHPRAKSRSVENEHCRVTFNEAGDIASILDRNTQRQVLASPATLVFTHERPRQYPAWNMDWTDRQRTPIGTVDGTPQWRLLENGPVRASLAVTRWARNSKITQVLRLTRGSPIVEVDCRIDWQSAGCALKASFPLSVHNPEATYNWGLGTIKRGNNEPRKYEVPSHEFIDLTDVNGGYGITVLEDSKFGSDKPSDNELRLTLLYTPGVRGSYMDQHSQDWGVHDIRYGLVAHTGQPDLADQWGRRFNQPLRAFCTARHAGSLGREFSFLRTNTSQVDVRTIKVAEESDRIVVRVQELLGRPGECRLTFPARILSAEVIDGQERVLGSIDTDGSEIAMRLTPFELRSIAVTLVPSLDPPTDPRSGTPVRLDADTDVVSLDNNRSDGAMDPHDRSYPGETWPERIVDRDVEFRMGSAAPGNLQAVTCRGQRIDLRGAKGNQVHLLAAATEDVQAVFHVDDAAHRLGVQSWTGFVGQWYDRVWDRKFGRVDGKCDGRVTAILPGYIKRDAIAWFATHRHHPTLGNEAYRFSYLYHLALPVNDRQARTLTLPHDERIRVFAITVADGVTIAPAAPLYDVLDDGRPIDIRHVYADDKPRVSDDVEPAGDVRTDRAREFERLVFGPPRNDDDVDAATDPSLAFRVHAPNPDLAVHPRSGAIDGALPRLNDGLRAEDHDDTDRCVWFDNEGRFTIDLLQPREIKAVTTYSWHWSNRAPQYFSLWGSLDDTMPDPGFTVATDSGWQLLGVVDTRPHGDGQIHVSRLENGDGSLGPYRHLLWISEDMGEGTFYTEIDIDFADTTP